MSMEDQGQCDVCEVIGRHEPLEATRVQHRHRDDVAVGSGEQPTKRMFFIVSRLRKMTHSLRYDSSPNSCSITHDSELIPRRMSCDARAT